MTSSVQEKFLFLSWLKMKFCRSVSTSSAFWWAIFVLKNFRFFPKNFSRKFQNPKNPIFFKISKIRIFFKNLRSKGRMRIRISFIQKRFSWWFRWCRPILIKSSSFNMRWRHRFPVCQIAISKCWNKIGNTCTKIFDKHMSNSRWAGLTDCLWRHV